LERTYHFSGDVRYRSHEDLAAVRGPADRHVEHAEAWNHRRFSASEWIERRNAVRAQRHHPLVVRGHRPAEFRECHAFVRHRSRRTAGHVLDVDTLAILPVGSREHDAPAGVVPDGPRQEIIEHARERGFAFPMIKDEGHVMADRLGADRTPEAFLVDATGRLRYRGWVKSKQGSPDLQRALDAVLEGRPVRRPVTKAFGCAVDRY